MTSTYTPNLNLQLQGVGDNVNTWGTILNTNVFTILDQALGSKEAITTTGGTLDLSTAQTQYLYISFNGTLTSASTIVFPSTVGKLVFINNATSGAYTLTVEPLGGTGLIIPQGTTVAVLLDSVAGVASNATNSSVNFETSIASATTTDLGSTGSNVIKVTGTTTITALGSSALLLNCLYFVKFAGALTLTYNSTSLKLPGSANITTAADDCGIFEYLGSGNWRCLVYSPSNGVPAGVAPLASPNFTGNVNVASLTASEIVATDSSKNLISITALPAGTTAVTQTASDNSTKVATTAYVDRGTSGSSMILLSSQTASNVANINFTSIPSGYDIYILKISSVVPANSTDNLVMQFSTNNGSSYIGGSVYFTTLVIVECNSGATTYESQVGASSFQMTGGIDGSHFGAYGNIELMLNNTVSSCWTSILGYSDSSALARPSTLQGTGECSGNTAINAIQFSMSTGNISTGKFALYGIRNS